MLHRKENTKDRIDDANLQFLVLLQLTVERIDFLEKNGYIFGNIKNFLKNSKAKYENFIREVFKRQETIEEDTAKEAARQYGDEAAEKIVANLSDDALLKYGGKELAGKAIATETERAALRTAAKTEIGRQVATQARNAAFAKTLAGRGLAGVGAVAGAVGKFLFSAPVQTILMVELGMNLAASARTNNQVRNIKEYQGAKQAYFNNPATQSAIQKGGAIYQNNNNDLNFLLSSPNVATQVANRR